MKTLLSFLISFMTISGYSQMAVSDAGTNSALTVNNALSQQNLAKNTSILAKAVATLKTLSDMKKQYDEWESNIEEVNGMIETGKQIVKTTKAIGKIADTYEDAVSYISNEDMIHPTEKAKFINVLTKKVNESIDDLEECIDISTSGNYKMTDAERLQLLKDIMKKVEYNKGFMNYFLQKIKASVNQQKTKKTEKEYIENSVNSFKKR